jgi:CRISPR-associated protein Cst1
VEQKIRLEMSDWLYNAGLVGLINMLDHAKDNYKLCSNYVEFDMSSLEGFEEKYFKFLFDKYGAFTVYESIVENKSTIENYIKNIKEFDEKMLENLNQVIDYVKSKISRNSYKAAYPYINQELDLIKVEKELKKIKLNKNRSIASIEKDIRKQLELLMEIINYMSTEEAKKYLIAKDFIYSFTNAFLTGVAVWHKKEAAKDPYIVYKEYFIDSTITYLAKQDKKHKSSCTVCNRSLGSKDKTYDLTWIIATGVDGSRKSSHYWNYNNDTMICPICNLVYSCIPAGFTFINGKGFFINNNNDLIELYKVNKFQIDKDTKIEELEELSYYNVLDNMDITNITNMDREIQNIQIVKYNSTNQIRPYTFNILSKLLLHIIYNNKDNLKKLLGISIKVNDNYWINVYQEVLKRLYNNENQFNLLGELFGYNVNPYILYLILIINTDFIGGKMELENKDDFKKKVDLSRYFGLELRKAYETKENEKKIESISYRLLNAIKTKNFARFADILINSYMYVEKEIPSIFIDTLKDEVMLQSYGYGFLLGLQGSNVKNDNKSKEEK